MPALLINGVDSETLGFTLSEVPGWLDAPPRQTPNAAILGRAGAKELAEPIEQPRRLTLRGMVRATTFASARTKLDALKLALLAKPLKLTFADNPTRYISARLESFPTSLPQGALGPFVQENLQIEATLTAYDPLSYDSAITTVNSPTANNLGGFIVPGTGPVRPLVSLTGAVVNPTLTLFDKNGVAFGAMTFTVTMVGGDVLLVDCDAKTIKLNGVSRLDILTTGDFFVIDPFDSRWTGAGGWINASAAVISYSFFKSWR